MAKPMLIDFFLKLKSHKLPVSIKEYLTLLDAMDKKVIEPSIDQFYYLARIALVKDEANFDKFDRAFAEFWEGVETIPGIEAQIPLEWLLKQVELNLTEEEKRNTDWAKPARCAARNRRRRTRRLARPASTIPRMA